jgi:hypothetical protein
MKPIEDEFQPIADSLMVGRHSPLSSAENERVSYFFALWHIRAFLRERGSAPVQMKGITGTPLSKDEEENLEKGGLIYAREDGSVPGRLMNGIEVKVRTDDHVHRTLRGAIWGVLRAASGEFLVPDAPTQQVLPVSPKIVLAANWPNRFLTAAHVDQINELNLKGARGYVFACDLAAAVGRLATNRKLRIAPPRLPGL